MFEHWPLEIGSRPNETAQPPDPSDMNKKLGKWLVILACITYPILLHTCISQDDAKMSHLLLAFVPLLLMAVSLLFRAVSKNWWPAIALLLAVLVYYLVTEERGRVGLLAVNELSYVSLYLFLTWLFGRTLQRGREPLISQIARHITGPLTPEIIIYTRQVTIAWCVFFILQIIISLSLFILAPVTIWSLFINVLDLPLLAMMFIGENSYRILRFPDHQRTSILKVIEVYAKDFAVPRHTDHHH